MRNIECCSGCKFIRTTVPGYHYCDAQGGLPVYPDEEMCRPLVRILVQEIKERGGDSLNKFMDGLNQNCIKEKP